MSSLNYSFRKPPRHMTFDGFVPCGDNMTALQLAILVSDGSQATTPVTSLYLYGDQGVGKTHLLGAIFNAPNHNTSLYVQVGDLKDKCEAEWNKGYAVDLKQYLIEPDILLLDDVHLAAEHEQFHRELFNIIRLRGNANLCVVLVGDKPPASLDRSDVKLSAIFSNDKIIKVGPCDGSGRYEILKSYLKSSILPDKAVKELALALGENCHVLVSVAQAIKTRPEIFRLLPGLGYSVYRCTKTLVGDEEIVVLQWRDEYQGRKHVADVVISPQSRRISSRCWCRI